MVVWQPSDTNVLLEKWHLFLVMLKKLNELFRLNVICSDFENSEGRVAVPALVNVKVEILVFVYNWNFVTD